MLIEKLNNMSSTDLEKLYLTYWKLAKDQHFTKKDYIRHLTSYIIQYYQFRSLSQNYRKKAHELIKQIKKH